MRRGRANRTPSAAIATAQPSVARQIRWIRWALPLAGVMLWVFAITAARAATTTRTWDGGCGADTNWSCAANWSGNTLPVAGDTVAFNGTATGDSVVDQGFDATQTIGTVKISAGYTGTVSLAAPLHVTTAFTLSGSGAFTAANQLLDLNGSLTISAGSFTASSSSTTLAGALSVVGSPTFDANGGTFTFDGSKSATLACGDIGFNVVSFHHTAGTKTVGAGCQLPMGTAPVIPKGAAVSLGGLMAGSGTLTVGASGSSTSLTVTGAGHLSGFTGLVENGTLAVSGATLDASTYAPLDINGGLAVSNGATFQAPPLMTVSGGVTVDSASTFLPGAGTVRLDGSTSATVSCTSAIFHLVTFAQTGGTKTVGPGCVVPVGGNPTLGTAGSITVNGGLSGTGALHAPTLTLGSTGSLSGFTGLTTSSALSVAGATGDFSTLTTFTVGGSYSQTGGTVFAPSSGMTVSGSFTLSGTASFRAPSATLSVAQNFTANPGIQFDPNGGTVRFANSTSNATISCAGVTFHTVTFTAVQATKTVAANCTLPLGTNPFLPGGSSKTSPTLIVSGTLSGTGTLTVNPPIGTTVPTLELLGGGNLAGFSGLVAPTLVVDGDAADFGSFTTLSVNALTIRNTAQFTAPAGDMSVSGPLTLTADSTFEPNAGTVHLTGATQAITGSVTFFNLLKTAPNDATLKFAAGSAQTVTGTLSLTGTSGHLLMLASTTAGTPWAIDPEGPTNLDFLGVADSDNISGTPITATHSNDLGGNTGWTFPGAPPHFTATQVAAGVGVLGRPLGLGSGGSGIVYITDLDQAASPGYSKPGRLLEYQRSTGAVNVVYTGSFGFAPTDIVAGPGGTLYFVDHLAGTIDALAPNAVNPTVVAGGLSHPDYLAIDPAGQHLYVTDQNNYVVKRVTIANGAVAVIAGTGNPASVTAPCPTGPAPATSVDIGTPFGLAVGPDGSVYIGDQYRHLVYRLSAGMLTPVAGNCTKDSKSAGTGDSGPATAAQVPYPQGLAVDAQGNLYILQIQGQVRRVDASTGTIATVYRGPTADSNTDLTYDATDGSLYLTSQDVPSLTWLTSN
jgi:fibronectin-binding autotransporter adhesin